MVACCHSTDSPVLGFGLVDWNFEQSVPELEVGLKLGVREVISFGWLSDYFGLESLSRIPTGGSNHDLFVTTVSSFHELKHLFGRLLEFSHRDDVCIVPLIVVDEGLKYGKYGNKRMVDRTSSVPPPPWESISVSDRIFLNEG